MYCNDLPESHLQIGGVRFYQFFQDMNVNVPTDWDILEDPIYYTTINGQVVLYNDITRELVTESQDNQDDLVKTYEVSTVEGLENDDMFLFDLLDEMFAALTPPTNP
jgi:hypothetical protein